MLLSEYTIYNLADQYKYAYLPPQLIASMSTHCDSLSCSLRGTNLHLRHCSTRCVTLKTSYYTLDITHTQTNPGLQKPQTHASFITCSLLHTHIHTHLQCDRSTSLKEFFNIFAEGSNPKIAVIGNGCSVATEPVAEISQFFNALHVSSFPIM